MDLDTHIEAQDHRLNALYHIKAMANQTLPECLPTLSYHPCLLIHHLGDFASASAAAPLAAADYC